MRFESLVFRSIVFGTLVTGLTGIALTLADYHRLEVCLCKFARKALRGAADLKTILDDGSIKHKSLTNSMVLKRFGLACVQTELTVYRLGLMQRSLKDTKHHEQYLTAFFGNFEFEKDHPLVHSFRIELTGS